MPITVAQHSGSDGGRADSQQAEAGGAGSGSGKQKELAVLLLGDSINRDTLTDVRASETVVQQHVCAIDSNTCVKAWRSAACCTMHRAASSQCGLQVLLT